MLICVTLFTYICVWPSEKKHTLSSTSENVRCVQNNAEQMPKYVILSNNSSILLSVKAVHLCACALLSCRVSLNNDAIYFDCVLIVYLALRCHFCQSVELSSGRCDYPLSLTVNALATKMRC